MLTVSSSRCSRRPTCHASSISGRRSFISAASKMPLGAARTFCEEMAFITATVLANAGRGMRAIGPTRRRSTAGVSLAVMGANSRRLMPSTSQVSAQTLASKSGSRPSFVSIAANSRMAAAIRVCATRSVLRGGRCRSGRISSSSATTACILCSIYAAALRLAGSALSICRPFCPIEICLVMGVAIGGTGISATVAVLVWYAGRVLAIGRGAVGRIIAQTTGLKIVDWLAVTAGPACGRVTSFSFPTTLGEDCMGQQNGPSAGITERPALLVLRGY